MYSRDPAELKGINHARHKWLELVVRDPIAQKRPTAVVLAVFVFQRFHAVHGFAEFSDNYAARELGLDRRSIARAKNFLLKRGWLSLKEKYKPGVRGYMANRYAFAFGPDDLDPAMHGDSSDTPDAGVIA
jgi:hypothetical protein